MKTIARLKRIAIAAALVAVSSGLGLAVPAQAATTGAFVDTFSGNDPFPGAIFPMTKNESVALYKCDDIKEGLNPF